MAEWQPIATAPRDGTRVLVYVPKLEGIFACGFEYGSWQTGVWSGAKPEPSHWMPLPAIPTESATKAA